MTFFTSENYKNESMNMRFRNLTVINPFRDPAAKEGKFAPKVKRVELNYYEKIVDLDWSYVGDD